MAAMDAGAGLRVATLSSVNLTPIVSALKSTPIPTFPPSSGEGWDGGEWLHNKIGLTQYQEPNPPLRPGPTCAVGADHSNSLAGAPLAPDASYLSPDSIHAPNSPGTATTPSSCLLASWRGRRASAWLLWQIQFCARLCSIRLTLPVPRSRRYGPRNQGRSASRPGTHLC